LRFCNPLREPRADRITKRGQAPDERVIHVSRAAVSDRVRSTRPLIRVLLLPLAAIAIAMAGCGGSDSTSGEASSTASTQEVTIQDYLYEPARLTVTKGTTIDFTNKDSTAHTATSTDSGTFESGSIQPGKTGSITLSRTGTFAFYCTFHPFMKGTITVEP
jgi:plastocyanin